MLRYKLTDANGETHNGTQWGPGVVYHTNGMGNLCGPGWLHCYDDPILAILLNPSQANFSNPRMCEVECTGTRKTDRGLKEGWTTMAFIRWVDPPVVTNIQRIAFAILCAKEVYKDEQWNSWADAWLDGSNRTAYATAADADAADAATADAADAYAAATAADATAYAATAYAADADAADAATAIATAIATADAADAAAYAAIDLKSLAVNAMAY